MILVDFNYIFETLSSTNETTTKILSRLFFFLVIYFQFESLKFKIANSCFHTFFFLYLSKIVLSSNVFARFHEFGFALIRHFPPLETSTRADNYILAS